MITLESRLILGLAATHISAAQDILGYGDNTVTREAIMKNAFPITVEGIGANMAEFYKRQGVVLSVIGLLLCVHAEPLSF